MQKAIPPSRMLGSTAGRMPAATQSQMIAGACRGIRPEQSLLTSAFYHQHSARSLSFLAIRIAIHTKPLAQLDY
jgi:hypothetical protein